MPLREQLSTNNPKSAQDFLRTYRRINQCYSEKVVAPQCDNQQNDGTATSLICRFLTVVDSKNLRGSMSQTESPQNSELERLRAVVQDYERRLSAAAELVARVRHEINNPLAALLGQAQLLLREELSDKARRRAETIESQAKRIEEIAGQLRAVQAPPSALDNHG